MKRFIILSLALALALVTGCQALDVVLNQSPAALDSILSEYPEIQADDIDGYYVLSVDGETKLLIGKDYTASGSEDLAIVTPIAPFVAAGLDPTKLGEGYRVEGDLLYLTADYGDGPAQSSPSAALLQSAHDNRKMLSYHADMDHFGIMLPAGKFEFAKDHKNNDKDIVFVMMAEPLAELGLDVEKVDGWAYMEMDNMNGGIDKVLLKPYTL